MLVAIEGIDGCGKGTQTARLCAVAEKHGLSAASFSFPRYGENAYSQAIARYLNGEFGGVSDVAAEFAALLYAGDRLAAREELLQAMKSNDLVICDRYVPSNLAHQAAKLSAERRGPFLSWLAQIEYEIHRTPRPDVSVLLQVPVNVAVKMVAQKRARAYTPLKADIHEADESYLQACADVYEQLARTEPEQWIVVDCTGGADSLDDADRIAAAIWTALAERFSAVAAFPAGK